MSSLIFTIHTVGTILTIYNTSNYIYQAYSFCSTIKNYFYPIIEESNRIECKKYNDQEKGDEKNQKES